MSEDAIHYAERIVQYYKWNVINEERARAELAELGFTDSQVDGFLQREE
jgi:hypothetical protein